jgi:hypothetical protein
VIKIAYLVGAESPATTIAGLPVLLRQALSLQEAGIDALALVGVRDRSVLRDPRLRIPVRDASIADVGANGPALVAAVGCVWPQALVRWLVDVHVDESDVATRGEGGTAILACGAGRVREIVERVGRGEFGKPPQSPQEIDASVAMLLQSLYKPTDGLIARSIDRRVSLAITRRLLTTRITPNQMTLLATLVGAVRRHDRGARRLLERAGWHRAFRGAGGSSTAVTARSRASNTCTRAPANGWTRWPTMC